MKTIKGKETVDHNILIVGDLHEPFCLDGYLEFCVDTYNEWDCKEVVFIGDLVDNHYSSYHETDPDGMGGGEELTKAIEKIAKWYKAFPEATVIWGNHDRMIMRKAFSSDIPKAWIKPYNEVLGTPKWKWIDRYVVGDVQFIHGEGGTARTRCKSDLMKTIQGHLHTQCFTEHFVGANYHVFGTQVGCGIDFDAYSMAYAKRGKKPAIGNAVLMKGGNTVVNNLMQL